MTATDGLPFSIFTTSVQLRKSLQARGFGVPKSPNTVRNMVIKYGTKVQNQYKCQLQGLKINGTKFSLTFDEWMSTKNRRYLNVNAHVQNEFWNLGLIRVRGSLPAESCIELVNERLKIYGLNLEEDIICITTDGAAVMQKVGRLLSCLQQLCFAHAIHLAVVEVLYTKPKNSPIEEVFDIESDDDDESNCDGLQVVNDEDVPDLINEL